MAYNKNADGSFTFLAQKNVDTGMSLERLYAIINGLNSVYETEFFLPLILKMYELSGVELTSDNERQYRIICEHTRAVTFILGDPKAITPSNTEQGYIVRRLIRRAIRHSKNLFDKNIIPELAVTVIEQYGDVYPEIENNKAFIIRELERESTTFEKTLELGIKRAEKYFTILGDQKTLDGDSAFKLYDTFGFPIELTEELASEKGVTVDLERFRERFAEHQELSRKGAEAKFKGGMADNSDQTTKLHTATHLLDGALRTVLGNNVFQRGSNITSERLRFDFSFDRKLTADELSKVTDIVNEAIQKNIPVICEEMNVEEAKRQGAIGVFDERYGSLVKVYTIEGYSREICGGPHASNTGELKLFKILKEESSSSGVRRIKAVIG